jgi:hypothetical protein
LRRKKSEQALGTASGSVPSVVRSALGQPSFVRPFVSGCRCRRSLTWRSIHAHTVSVKSARIPQPDALALTASLSPGC